MSRIKNNLIGQRFGRLTVIEEDGRFLNKDGKNLYIIWKCKCDCGRFINSRLSNLKSGNTKSCGCYNTEVVAKRCRLPAKESNLRILYNLYRNGAMNRGLDFKLNETEFRKLISQNCFYCKCEPDQIFKRNLQTCMKPEWIEKCAVTYNGIDRIDNNIGYNIKNSVTCCGVCNRMKLDQTLENFYKKIELIYNNRIKK